MFQSFAVTSRPEQGPPRLAALRDLMAKDGLDGYLVPRADAFQGEYVAARDERLAWLTGFTGSAGFCAVLADVAGVFVDGRYRIQAREQTDPDSFTPVNWPETELRDWLITHLPKGGTVGFDPWLHTINEIERLEPALAKRKITLKPVDNRIDAIWNDRPAPPANPATSWPEVYAGTPASEKLRDCAAPLSYDGHQAALISQCDSLCWLLNIRGSDIAHTPLVQAMGVLHGDGALDLFVDAAKLTGVDLPGQVRVHPPKALEDRLTRLNGPVRLDPRSAPYAAKLALEAADITVAHGDDPCVLPKACKTEAEIAATTAAHLRDGAAMVRFLHWFDETAPKGGLDEITCAKRLEAFRAETGVLKEISFDTISAAGPHSALPHYRVSEDSNAPLEPGQLYLVDSGGQYEDGTTDITRTLPVGEVGRVERVAFTQVLKGMIAIHLARFPEGLAGRDIDALARATLWAAGRDFDHGTGHGVGVYLGVHEGPQRLSRGSTVVLQPGMILSNEPGYYREGAFGIRIENLVVLRPAPPVEGGDPGRKMLCFETLTWVPIDTRLVERALMDQKERDWLNTYHAEVAARIGPLLDGDAATWLAQATAPI